MKIRAVSSGRSRTVDVGVKNLRTQSVFCQLNAMHVDVSKYVGIGAVGGGVAPTEKIDGWGVVSVERSEESRECGII